MSSATGPANIVLLIFGGCCANVFALETLIRSESSSGLLITFFQFLFTALAASATQLSAASTTGGRYGLKEPQVPLRKWARLSAMHFGINMLNNWAFAYNISVPVHIILRSFGSVSTMIAGKVRGKRYSAMQVLSVVLLTVGVVVSAWADAQGKGKSMSVAPDSLNSDFGKGLAILLLAQVLSAIMGVYTEDAYATHGASWKEALFYQHFLCLPLFLPLAPILRDQYSKLIATPPEDVEAMIRAFPSAQPLLTGLEPVIKTLPQGVLLMVINIATQLLCISGVNLLCAMSSAVTVTIVLNIRKLVSFILSTIIFGHQLSGTMVLGSTLVFGSGALYGWETSWRLPQRRKAAKEANGNVEKSR